MELTLRMLVREEKVLVEREGGEYVWAASCIFIIYVSTVVRFSLLSSLLSADAIEFLRIRCSDLSLANVEMAQFARANLHVSP